MNARRKLRHDPVAPSASSVRPALAGAESAPVGSPVHEHLARLQTSFAEAQEPAPFPVGVRVAIMVGAPALLWGAVILSVGALARLAGA